MVLPLVPQTPLTLRQLADRVRSEGQAALLVKLGPLCLVGPPGRPTENVEFRYATAHSPVEDRPSPLISLLDSIVLPLAKRRGGAFPDRLVVGRASTSDLWIDDQSVSKLHARIRICDGVAQLTDAGSTNGTFVGGRRLPASEPIELSSGQSIRFGDREFKARDPSMLLERVVAFHNLP